jgi:hypothetical protein
VSFLVEAYLTSSLARLLWLASRDTKYLKLDSTFRLLMLLFETSMCSKLTYGAKLLSDSRDW